MPAGEIPHSPALSEAYPTSLQELFSRDPEGYQRQDLAAIVTAMRQWRIRLEEAEAAGKKPRQTRAQIESAPIDLDSLGI